MEIKGYISSTEESAYEFYFEMNGHRYFVPKIEENLMWINEISCLAYGDSKISIEYEEFLYYIENAIKLTRVQKLPKIEHIVKLELKDYIKPEQSFHLGYPNSCSFCAHIYIRSKEHRYGDDCIVWVDDDECDPPMFKLYMSGAYMPIGYCPMCGRKLKDIQSD